jgi:NTP pyrophosphatase (non-canonical NTP hydrolase)
MTQEEKKLTDEATLTIKGVMKEAHETALSKGWWRETHPRTLGDVLMTFQEEILEAFREFNNKNLVNQTVGEMVHEVKAFREFKQESEDDPDASLTGYTYELLSLFEFDWDRDTHKPVGFVIELADLLIRVLDFCAFTDMPIEEALKEKLRYNKTRPRRHGGRTI